MILGFINCLLGGQDLWIAVEPGYQHIGEKYAAQSHVDRYLAGRKSLAHGETSERLSAAQQFAVDLADGLQDLARSMIVGQELYGLSVRLLRHIIHLRPQAGIADRQIVLGAMTRAVGAFASRLAASFVAFDERTAEDGLEWGQLAQERLAAFP